MWQRIQTAIILIIIVGVALFASDTPYLFVLLLTVGVSFAAYEWTKLMPVWRLSPIYVLTTLAITLISLLSSVSWPLWWLASLLIWFVAIWWVVQYPRQNWWYGNLLIPIGFILLTAAMTAMFFLWQNSPWWLLYVFVLVWCADSGAYFVGRKLGKTKMAPIVSPNKSMEGLAGGILIGLIGIILIGVFVIKLTGSALLWFAALSIVTILFSVWGDLFESMLKRRADIKDSGHILPGHGGVLDRIDSLLAATPIFALGFWLLIYLDILPK